MMYLSVATISIIQLNKKTERKFFMKKLTPIIMIYMMLLCALPVCANDNQSIITGLTTDGIYYEAVITESDICMPLADADAVTLTQKITYEGIVAPSISIPFTKIIDGTTYSGTLYLQSFTQGNNKTVATYKGTLYAQ